ncbi:hypothetical protein [Streptomyces lavendulocolor]|uniref:hypothetical protein n=1 Tax=Streptomyces lavendulocolor TaxID=67316 RepID=UPI003C3054CF
MSDFRAVPVESRPWRPQDGPEPSVHSWPPGQRPALYVWDGSRWRYAVVQARQTYGNGRVVYQLLMPSSSVRSYEWPQPGLRVAHPPPGRGPPAARINAADA